MLHSLLVISYNEQLSSVRSLHDNQFQDDISSLHIQDISDEQAGCLSRKLGCWYVGYFGVTFSVAYSLLIISIFFLISKGFISPPNRSLFYRVGFKDWTSFSDLREKYSTNLASNRTFKSCINNQSFFLLLCTALNINFTLFYVCQV